MRTSKFLLDALDLPVVEPKKRMVGGRYGWAIHRFPIRGGKSMRETVWREFGEGVTRQNSLISRLLGQ